MPYIANKHNLAQLTNIHYWDSIGGAWSGNLIGAATPFAFLPNPVTLNDLVVFGIDTTVVNSGPFCSLAFDIGTVQTGLTIAWKYSDAAGVDPTTWAPLVPAVDPILDNTNQFLISGVNSVHWVQPTLWIVQNPAVGIGPALGVTGYWMCADVTNVVGVPPPPIQNNRRIYSVLWPSVEMGDVDGDMAALMRVSLRNESGGPTVGIQESANRILVGTRKLDRGEDFVPYINLAQSQNPPGITVETVGLLFAADVQTPAGEKVSVPAPAAAWTEYASIRIASGLAEQYRGIFRTFLRVDQTLGAAGNIRARLEVALYSGTFGLFETVVFTSQVADLLSVAPWETYDLGSVQLVPSDLAENDVYNIEIRIQLYGIGAGANIDLFDLAVLPVDEWAGEFSTSGALDWGWRAIPGVAGTIMDIDSVGVPKRSMNSLVRVYATNAVAYRAKFIGNAPATLDDGQRLHFLLIDFSAGAYSISHFALAGSLSMEVVARYSSMRGAR